MTCCACEGGSQIIRVDPDGFPPNKRRRVEGNTAGSLEEGTSGRGANPPTTTDIILGGLEDAVPRLEPSTPGAGGAIQNVPDCPSEGEKIPKPILASVTHPPLCCLHIVPSFPAMSHT